MTPKAAAVDLCEAMDPHCPAIETSGKINLCLSVWDSGAVEVQFGKSRNKAT